MELSAKKLAKATFASQDDAEKGLKDWNTSHSTDLSGWTVVSEIRSETHPLPRTGRGRPRKDAPVQTEQVLVVTVRLEPDEKARVLARSHHGLFILVTSHAVLWPKSPSDGPELKTPTEILEIYREQIEVEGGFRWIKAPSQEFPENRIRSHAFGQRMSTNHRPSVELSRSTAASTAAMDSLATVTPVS